MVFNTILGKVCTVRLYARFNQKKLLKSIKQDINNSPITKSKLKPRGCAKFDIKSDLHKSKIIEHDVETRDTTEFQYFFF